MYEEPLFSGKSIGNLYMNRVLVSYIYPRIFICRNDDGQRFLFYEMVGNDKCDKWLGIKITEEESKMLCTKQCSVQSLYMKCPCGELLTLTQTYPKDEEKSEAFITEDGWRIVGDLPEKPVYAEDM